MNFLHLTKNIKSLCQVYHRCGMPPILATEDEIIERDQKAYNKREQRIKYKTNHAQSLRNKTTSEKA